MTNPYKEHVINFTELHIDYLWLLSLNWQSFAYVGVLQ